MEILKKLLVFAAATAAAVYLVAWSLGSFGFRSPVFALLVNWIAMSWIAVLGLVIHFSFPADYYDVRPFERTGQLYERLGIRVYKSLVRRGPFAILSPTLRLPKETTVLALQKLEGKMRDAETGHALILVVIIIPVGYALLNGWLDAAGWMLFFNVLINGYPIMLQRYNRIKLQDLVPAQDGVR